MIKNLFDKNINDYYNNWYARSEQAVSLIRGAAGLNGGAAWFEDP